MSLSAYCASIALIVLRSDRLSWTRTSPAFPHQVIVFVSSVSRCQALADLLLEQNFPVLTIHRAMEQTERWPELTHITLFNELPFKSTCIITRGKILIILVSLNRLIRYQQFKDFQKRILVATNLFGRGMDIERVNLVINYDTPDDSDTYLHRVLFIWQNFSQILKSLNLIEFSLLVHSLTKWSDTSCIMWL